MIHMTVEGKTPKVRHVTRTHRVYLDEFFFSESTSTSDTGHVDQGRIHLSTEAIIDAHVAHTHTLTQITTMLFEAIRTRVF